MAILNQVNSENLLIDAVVQHFSKHSSLKIYREVAFLSKRIDVVLVNCRTDEIYAIETKISSWRRVIDQAKLNLLGADKVYVALPDTKKHTVSHYQRRLEKYGIGFLGIAMFGKKSIVREVIRPFPSRYKSPSREQELRSSIEKGLYLGYIK